MELFQLILCCNWPYPTNFHKFFSFSLFVTIVLIEWLFDQIRRWINKFDIRTRLITYFRLHSPRSLGSSPCCCCRKVLVFLDLVSLWSNGCIYWCRESRLIWDWTRVKNQVKTESEVWDCQLTKETELRKEVRSTTKSNLKTRQNTLRTLGRRTRLGDETYLRSRQSLYFIKLIMDGR